MSLKSCSRCGALVPSKQRCPNCYKPSKKTAEYGYDNRWTKLSKSKRIVDPLCEECERQGKVTPATEVHHIKPIATHPELRLDWDNLMSICRDCHDKLEPGRQGSKQ
jgi:5-methylcytosine-specific restriction endonuclease McrA